MVPDDNTTAETGGAIQERPVDEDLERRFTYHAPKGDQTSRYEWIRSQAKDFAYMLKANTSYSREQSLALTHLEEAVFWANAAIARNE